MARLSEEKIELIKNTYEKNGTYSQTAKIVGCSPATVKKYVTENTCSVPTKNKVLFSKTIPTVQEVVLNCAFKSSEFFTVLSDEEVEEMKVLWEEI